MTRYAYGSSISTMEKSTSSSSLTSASHSSFAEFCRYIPLRLTAQERALLQVVEQTLNVSEYTDNVDVTSARRGIKARRILDGIVEACHIATGLAIASGVRKTDVMKEAAETGIGTGSTKDGEGGEDNDGDRKKKKHSKKKDKKEKKKAKMAKRMAKRVKPLKHTANGASQDYSDMYPVLFEIARRNKVLNPSSMRTTYGKLMYMLQDAQNATVAKSLGFTLHKDLVLVGSYLEERGLASTFLTDPNLLGATQFVRDRDPMSGEKLDRSVVDSQLEMKRKMADEMVEKYSAPAQESADSQGRNVLTKEETRRIIDSISDAIVYVESNVVPVERMLRYLETHFDPHQPRDGFSLALNGTSRSTLSMSYYNRYNMYGSGNYGSSSDGPTLSHSHPTQYTFVWQSLRLWSKVMRHMHRLWICADADLLSTTSSYNLHNTGQGLNRVQSCPRVSKVMHALLRQTQQEAGAAWVGLSVIHLGDRDVPNALVFIDKYTQIPRFLTPLLAFVDGIPELCETDPRICGYIEKQFGSPRKLQMTVLTDYFKHGFDGSGDDGGSCIDGRLTSSWNWTSRVAKKSYYHALMMSGFQGFDGEFK